MNINKHLSFVYRLRQKYILEKLEPFEIGNTDYPLLLFLEKNSGYGQNEISREINMNKSLVTRSVLLLEKKEYIYKKISPENRKKNLLFLSEKGKEILPKIRQIIEGWEEQVLKDFTEEDIKKIDFLLEKMYLNSLK